MTTLTTPALPRRRAVDRVRRWRRARRLRRWAWLRRLTSLLSGR